MQLARGPRATEAVLLDEIERLADAVTRDPSLLACPTWIVVPSQGLREHLAARIVAARGRSVAGVALRTLHGLALEMLGNAGQPAPRGNPLFPVVVRQQAQREPVLRRALDDLQDGYGVVVATVSDLLDAGFEPAHAEAVDECLRASGTGDGVARARAVVRVAAASVRALEAAGLEPPAALFRRAREVLARDPEGALPARAVWIHGYADATGVQLELLEALVVFRGAHLLLDHPDAPPDARAPDPGVAFSERLRERLAGWADLETPATPPPPLACVQLFRAPGAHAEAREVAERIHALLGGGTVPERVGVVVRDLAPYLIALRTQLRRLGVPFSGGPDVLGPLAPRGRRLRALLDLLHSGEATRSDRWLEAMGSFAASGQGATRRARLADLRVGLHALGVARLRDLARLDAGRVLGAEDVLALPVRRGLATPGQEGDEDPGGGEPGRVVAPRRRLYGALLREAVERARAVLRRLERWRGVGRLAGHFDQLERLVREELAWDPDEVLARELHDRCTELRGALPEGFPLGLDDFVLLLGSRLQELGATRVGGRGGGVQVLGVMEARARTFEHLFVLGLNRDLFPRSVREDPLLPDALRRTLAAHALPDVPLKGRGRDEERYLFAQLYASSPHLTLSWQRVSDDGKEKTPSPLVERVLGSASADSVPLVPSLLARERARRPAPRPALEGAMLAGLRGPRGRRSFRVALELALREGRAGLGLPVSGSATDALAEARCAILRELDPTREAARELGPYFGFVGPVDGASDPRCAPLYVTTLEQTARCPWRTFLQRLLRLEAAPDALQALPEVDALMLGNLLHRTLERIVSEALGDSEPGLEAASRRPATPVAWPGAERLEAILVEEARGVLHEAGVVLPGFGGLLIERVRPYLERVRDLEARNARLPGVLGAEVEGAFELADHQGRTRRVQFRVDRVDAAAEGLRLTDYKSGRPPSDAKTETKRREQLLQAIGSGLFLQAPAYARGSGRIAEGRYVFARPELPDAVARVTVSGEDEEAGERLETATRALLRLWDAGSFAPRLEDGEGREPRACEFCEVSSACLRGDSGARRRIAEWADGAGEGGSEAERALLGVWRIGGRDA